MFDHANIRKDASEHSCLSVRMYLSILAHVAHLAQSFFLVLNGNNKCFDVSIQI